MIFTCFFKLVLYLVNSEIETLLYSIPMSTASLVVRSKINLVVIRLLITNVVKLAIQYIVLRAFLLG